MEHLKTSQDNKIIDYAGLLIIGIFSLGYVVFSIIFAKFHIYLSFLGAPLFIGEIAFVTCFLLFSVKWIKGHRDTGIFSWLFLGYLAFVVIKTFLGYFYWGALSLRHSVLFFYPLFAVFCYSFYRKDFFSPEKKLFCILIFLLVFKFSNFYAYFALTCFVLTLILINSCFRGKVRYILYSLLLLVFPYGAIFHSSRTFIMSNLIAIVFIGFGFLYMLRIRMRYKIIFCLVLLPAVFLVMAKNNSSTELKSIIGFKEMSKKYKETMELLRIKEATFKEEEFKIELYNDERDRFQGFGWLSDEHKQRKNKSALDIVLPKETSKPRYPVLTLYRKASKANHSLALPKEANKASSSSSAALAKEPNEVSSSPPALPKEENKAIKSVIESERSIETPYNNSLFRIFIWQEAFKQLITKRPLFGFDFGKPFRCRQIEILDWAQGEWRRDGWVCMHNSYIDILYRAGIVGLLMVISILSMLLFLAVNSLRRRSLNGVLLTGIILNWFMAANFLEILEMPYSAIPIWSLVGLTFAYLFKNNRP